MIKWHLTQEEERLARAVWPCTPGEQRKGPESLDEFFLWCRYVYQSVVKAMKSGDIEEYYRATQRVEKLEMLGLGFGAIDLREQIRQPLQDFLQRISPGSEPPLDKLLPVARAYVEWCHEQLQSVRSAGSAESVEPTNSKQVLPERCEQAFREYKLATQELEGHPKDRDVYDWLKRNYPKDHELPTFDTWARYLRKARRFHGDRKNNPVAGRGGRSLIRRDGRSAG